MRIEINGQATDLAGLARWTSQLVDECDRCGERISKRDEIAEVPGTEDPDKHEIIHADCMRPEEEIA